MELQQQALEVVHKMRDIVNQYSEQTDLNFSLLASSAEGVVGEFPAYDQNKYGTISEITDKKFYTNSFHVPVNIEIDCFKKISIEAPFHVLCNGGCITYVELAEIPVHNSEAICELATFSYEHALNYFGINFPLDVCKQCGHKGVLHEVCSCCGSTDIKCIRRISGYLSDVDNFTNGKAAELFMRYPNTKITKFSFDNTVR